MKTISWSFWKFVILSGMFYVGGSAAVTGQNSLPDRSGSGTITLFVYPPSDQLDFDSPRSLLRNTLNIELKRLLFSRGRVRFNDQFNRKQVLRTPYRATIGHTISHIDCMLSNGDRYDHWASFTGENYAPKAIRLLIKEQQGLGILMHNYEGGYIIQGEENVLRLMCYQGPEVGGTRLEPRYLQFEVQAEQCTDIRDMVEFFEQFHPDSGLLNAPPEMSGQDRLLYFTNMIDPYQCYLQRKDHAAVAAGGGCAPFAVALLKAGGLYDYALDALWLRSFRISEYLTGEKGGRKVPVWSVLFGRRGRSWEYEGYISRRLDIYDPSLIYQFITDAEKGLPPSLQGGKASDGYSNQQRMAHPAGFFARKGAPIALPPLEHIPPSRYLKRHGRSVVQGVVMEFETVDGGR